MAFSPLAFEQQVFELASAQTHIYTSDKRYWVPLKCKVEIYDPYGETLLLTYDMFNPPLRTDNAIGLLECDLTLGLVNSGIRLLFEDGEGRIDHNTIGLGNKILVYAGRVANDLTLIFTGYAEKRGPMIRGNNVMDYQIEGYSEMAMFNDIIVNFKRASTTLENINDPNFPRRPDFQMAINELIHDLFEDIDVRITRDIILKDYLGLDLSGISPLVTERLAAVVEPMRELSQVLDFFAEVSGGLWRVENGRLIFEYPDVQHSGIIIKNKISQFDVADSVSYFAGPWGYIDSISKEDGFANRIYVSTNIDTKSVANNMVNNGATALYRRAIAQQFQTLDSRISTIALLLSRIGDPFTIDETAPSTDIAEQVVDGEIRVDLDNTPNGPVIAQFKVPVGGLTSTADTVFVNDISIDAKVLSPTAKYWLVLFPTGSSTRSTIRWHHNNDLQTIKTNQFSAFAAGDGKSDLSDFFVNRFGPVYDFAIFARIRRNQEYSDPESIEKFRLKEDTMQLDFLDEPLSVAKMMQNVLATRGKPVRRYNVNEVTLPLGRWFTPGQNVTIVDDVGHHEESKNIFAEINEVRYSWSTSDMDSTLGTFKVSVLPVGHLNWHREQFPPGD